MSKQAFAGFHQTIRRSGLCHFFFFFYASTFHDNPIAKRVSFVVICCWVICFARLPLPPPHFFPLSSLFSFLHLLNSFCPHLVFPDLRFLLFTAFSMHFVRSFALRFHSASSASVLVIFFRFNCSGVLFFVRSRSVS